MRVDETLVEIEQAGVGLRLDGERVRIRFLKPEQREELAHYVAFLRAHRDEVAKVLKCRLSIPRMPPGVTLVGWNLKPPPVGIEMSAVVTDPSLFARATLEQLRIAMAKPRRWVGWSVPQLLDRLAQVGVIVALDSQSLERQVGCSE
jgi:hypothetical protein